ncbi:hypothetical protein [Streptomyces sp. NPDC000931]|uniref:hypothetical protein n=1 Tax=Streptomyces sp. NPDC000931 TaxID=3154372 RepID=UPI00332D4EF2
MAMCKKCGEQKRSWPRSCSRCRSGRDWTEPAADAADLASAAGLLGWFWRGVKGVVRLVLRTAD